MFDDIGYCPYDFIFLLVIIGYSNALILIWRFALIIYGFISEYKAAHLRTFLRGLWILKGKLPAGVRTHGFKLGLFGRAHTLSKDPKQCFINENPGKWDRSGWIHQMASFTEHRICLIYTFCTQILMNRSLQQWGLTLKLHNLTFWRAVSLFLLKILRLWE